MNYDLLSQNIMYLPGVGPRRSKILNDELSVYSLRDLLSCFPIKYLDRSTIFSINSISPDMQFVQIKGQFVSFESLGKGSGRRREGIFTDGTGTVRVVWFRGLKYVEKSVKLHTPYLLIGKPNLFNGEFNIVHPDLDAVRSDEDIQRHAALRPIYRVTEKMKRAGVTSNVMEQLVLTVFDKIQHLQFPETLPDYLIRKYHLPALDETIHQIHLPSNLHCIPRAEYRLKFEELFFLQLDILHYAKSRSLKVGSFVFRKIGDFFMRFYRETLPFQLTEAQKRVMREIRADLGSGRQMNRLLQGDVGSGKTIVAVMTMLIAVDNGYQACIMAPTEILAEQHYDSLRQMLQPLGLRVEMLTGVVKGKRRTEVLAGLRDGTVQILVGTHAILEENVDFHNLGMAVIDEQHRFGVEQRSRLWFKNATPPHILVMTATPIPRTLAMTVYGDLDVSIIDELPPGRKPIQTLHFYDESPERLVSLIRREVAVGHQIYYVFPLIKESEKSDLKNLEKGFEHLTALFPDMKIAMLHGQMKPVDKNAVMQEFIDRRVHILVSTTVIEVGVNVPNASVMVIENTERFGLAQLHQLRGRVGRGAEQSYCILVTGYKLSETTRKRIEIMCETTDGFRIAEEDLKLRGPGDIEGTRQSGILFDLKVASLARDGALLQTAREAAQEVVDADPYANLPQNQVMWNQLRSLRKSNVNWSSIS